MLLLLLTIESNGYFHGCLMPDKQLNVGHKEAET